ncbi:MAG: hypothetical protein ABL311_04700 [Nitratireductor rhodophyticola]|uniref:hypothetical protein n=1 Tax=Nitratireductor rhodophyticola TaxID=2854036 RepID=UPI0032D905DD
MAGNLYEQGYYEAGTASVTQGETVVTGQGTAWSQIVRPADDFGKHVGMPIPIASVDSDTQITLAYPWPGPTQAAAPYRVTFTPYHVAYRQALQEIGQLLSSGNVSALAALDGAADKLPMFTGPGALELIAKQDLVNGVRFDVQVADLAGRAAYDNEAAGFTVLVADVGDGRSAVYTKNSVAAADWSDPAYITGPTGATGSPWEDWQGAWATATAYDKLAGVENNGSSYICTTAHASDAASEPGVGASWQTYWDLVAAKGTDGTGTGDVVGPNSATNNNVALFDGTTGKVLKDGGALGTAAFTSSGDYVSVAGAGALSGFRNKIINGDLTGTIPGFPINQANHPTPLAPGINVYGYDQWRGHADGLEQVCEGLEAGEYTLTWTGGGNGRLNGGALLPSPIKATVSAGDISVVVPAVAGRVSLVKGDATAETDPFSPRHIQQELALCQRYFIYHDARQIGYCESASAAFLRMSVSFKQRMRSAPSVVTYMNGVVGKAAVVGGAIVDATADQITPDGFGSVTFASTANPNGIGLITAYEADARFYA